MAEQWWVKMNFAGDHTVRRTPPPEWEAHEYEGPFPSFSSMRRAILRDGTIEVDEIHRLQRAWRSMRKSEVIVYG